MKCSKYNNKIESTKLNSIQKVFVIFATILTVFAGIAVGLSFFDKNKSDSAEIKSIISDYSTEYEVINQNNDGTYEVKIVAPDFAVLVEATLDKAEETIAAETLQDAIRDYPGTIKTYIFTVNSLSNDEIRAQFMDDVTYDIMIVAIQNSDYEEGAGVNE